MLVAEGEGKWSYAWENWRDAKGLADLLNEINSYGPLHGRKFRDQKLQRLKLKVDSTYASLFDTLAFLLPDYAEMSKNPPSKENGGFGPGNAGEVKLKFHKKYKSEITSFAEEIFELINSADIKFDYKYFAK